MNLFTLVGASAVVSIMHAFKPLFAADWIQIGIFLFIVISSLLAQMVKAAKQQRDKARRKQLKREGELRPADRRRPADRPPAQPVAKAEQGRRSLEEEIETFLHKNLGGEAKGQRQQQAVPAQRKRTSSAQQKPKHSAQRPPRPPVQRRPSPEATPFPEGESVGGHVQRHIQSDNVGEHASHLGDALGNADERLESRLHDVFDHQLGSLSSTQDSRRPSVDQGTDSAVWRPTRDSNPLADEVRTMLSNPMSVRSAILLSEIIRRPDDPWQ